jgi:hypothetical protein
MKLLPINLVITKVGLKIKIKAALKAKMVVKISAFVSKFIFFLIDAVNFISENKTEPIGLTVKKTAFAIVETPP